MEKKNNNLIIVLMGVIIVILGVLCVLFATGKISVSNLSNNNELNNSSNQQMENVIQDDDIKTDDTKNLENNNSLNKLEADTNKLYSIGKGDFNFVKRIYHGEKSFGITADGNVLVGFDYIRNLKNAVDIIVFENMQNTILYILDTNGDLYQYNLKNIDSNQFEAEKNSNYSNVKKIFEYQTIKKNAGGCMRLVIIDKNDNYTEIDSNCV